MFEGSVPYAGLSILKRAFFSWATPIVEVKLYPGGNIIFLVCLKCEVEHQPNGIINDRGQGRGIIEETQGELESAEKAGHQKCFV